MLRKHLTPIISIVTILLLFISSLHAVQVLGAATPPNDDHKRVDTEHNQSSRLAAELHHHTDKMGSQLIKDINDHHLYADNRSLRLTHKKDTLRHKLFARWLRVLHEIHLVHG